MLCRGCFSSCCFCLSYDVDMREKISVQLGEGRCSKGQLFVMLIICPNQCCCLLPMLTSMRAVGYWALLKIKLCYWRAKIGTQILNVFPLSILELLLDRWLIRTDFSPGIVHELSPWKFASHCFCSKKQLKNGESGSTVSSLPDPLIKLLVRRMAITLWNTH